MLVLRVGGGKERGMAVDSAGGKPPSIPGRRTKMILTRVASARCDIFMTSGAFGALAGKSDKSKKVGPSASLSMTCYLQGAPKQIYRPPLFLGSSYDIHHCVCSLWCFSFPFILCPCMLCEHCTTNHRKLSCSCCSVIGVCSLKLIDFDLLNFISIAIQMFKYLKTLYKVCSCKMLKLYCAPYYCSIILHHY